MTNDAAETLALQALAWLAADDDLLTGFLAQTGANPAALRRHAGERDMLAAVMAYVLAEDDRIIAAAAALGERPETLAAAARQLTGEVPHWT